MFSSQMLNAQGQNSLMKNACDLNGPLAGHALLQTKLI
jgi:hypothetical protein